MFYLIYALLRPERSERRAMTIIGWIQILLYCAIIVAIDAAARRAT